MKSTPSQPKPFTNCPALDGYHCQTNSLAKIFHFYGHPLSEDMLLGLGAGMGFIYWKMKYGDSDYIFVGGRANNKNFFQDIALRTGVSITDKYTTSLKKANAALIDHMQNTKPLMTFVDMGYLPYFDLPEDYHFGGHTCTVCGWDGDDTFLISDIDQKASGLKKGFYYPISSEQLSSARNSPHKPFPPKNHFLEFNFTNYKEPSTEIIYGAIHQTIESQLQPPIKNVGIKGLRHTAKEIIKWPDLFDEHTLRMNLFNFYIFIEIGGTGGGCFRTMYGRFLKEASHITGNNKLTRISDKVTQSGKILTEIAYLFKNAEHMSNIPENIAIASEKFLQVADIEESAFSHLAECIHM